MRKLNKKLVLSIVALVMISTLGIGKALGYFTTHTNATGGYKMDLQIQRLRKMLIKMGNML